MWIHRLSEIALAGSIALLASSADAQSTTPASDDGLAESRERFQQGMQLYEQGAPADAIAIWEPIYRELGGHRGYRLAYDLALAYAAIGDPVRSADRLQAFLDEVDVRRARGESIGPAVTKEESDARARLAGQVSVLGRLQVAPGRPSVGLRVDAGDPHAAGAIVWVTPGTHTVTFDSQNSDAQTLQIDVAAGALVELVPPASPAKGQASVTQSAPFASAMQLPAMMPPSGDSPAPPTSPVPPAVIAITGGITLAAGVAAVALEIHANALRDDDIAEQARSPSGTIPAGDRSSFATARDWAYVAVGGAAGFGVLTAGLATWYFVARAHREGSRTAPRQASRTAPTVGVGLQGPRLMLAGSF